jgi:hypothetical protein
VSPLKVMWEAQLFVQCKFIRTQESLALVVPWEGLAVKGLNIVTCTPLIRWVLVRMIGFISSWDTHSLLIMLTYRPNSAITRLHNVQFTIAHALGFSVFTSRFPAMDLNTETITVSHCKYDT